MTARGQTIIAYRGDSALILVDVIAADGSPFQVRDGMSISWHMARTTYSATLILKSIGQGITRASASELAIEISATDSDLPRGVYVHELRVVDGQDVAVVTTGAFVIK